MFRPKPLIALSKAARIAAPAVLAGAAMCSNAQEIRIGAIHCKTGVTLHAKNASATDVLNALSRSLKFELIMEAPVDDVVNMDGAIRYSELLGRVAPSGNVVARYRSDPDCPAQYRLSQVWVLPAAGSAVAAKPPPRPPAVPQKSLAELERLKRLEIAAAKVSAVPVSPEVREQEELYMRGHGMLPPLDESAK